ncbi:MAG: hypothetical protein HYR85_00950 [Planctomycetes bacterium]|nr:hypothetical protein [Planctomycetota bacterium]MBI3844810.1 hypothetical protein [Planctomycetota bacterium]
MQRHPVHSFLMVCFMIMAVSCAGFRGDTVVKYESGTAPIVSQAPTGGTYELYDSTDMSPKVSVVLDKGDQIGFENGGPGEIVAIAHSQKVRLSATKNYYWKRV